MFTCYGSWHRCDVSIITVFYRIISLPWKVLCAPPFHPFLPPAPGNLWPFYCLRSFAFSRMSYSWNHTVCSWNRKIHSSPRVFGKPISSSCASPLLLTQSPSLLATKYVEDFPHTKQFSASWVSYSLAQFWPCLPGDNVRSHRLRARSAAPSHTHCRRQPQAQVIPCALTGRL